LKGLFFKLLAKLMRRNLKITPKDTIISQMTEPRPLPMGRQAFEEWSERIISGALLPGGEDDPEAFIHSQKFVLVDMLLHLGPTESHKPDAYFIHALRKQAVNEIALVVRKEMYQAAKAKKEAEESTTVAPN
jgi:hypothetical protein